jgi:wyosine [tRNA(Phe)-imidazoG37] synthetase (radical SAM superfamily)
MERHSFYAPHEIVSAVEEKIRQAQDVGSAVDYLTFVPDGEPTLDVNLGREVELLRPLGKKIAVITNSSLIWRDDVRADLRQADWVSLKIDAVQESAWRKVNRPNKKLSLSAILSGAREFAQAFTGDLAIETMLVRGVNDDETSLRAIALFLAELHPSAVYIAIPIRPPSESWVEAPSEQVLNEAYHVFSEHVENVEYLIGYEGNAFMATGDVEQDLLGITAVHPMREDAVLGLLRRAGREPSLIEELIEQGKLVRLTYRGRTFYIRRLPKVVRG